MVMKGVNSDDVDVKISKINVMGPLLFGWLLLLSFSNGSQIKSKNLENWSLIYYTNLGFWSNYIIICKYLTYIIHFKQNYLSVSIYLLLLFFLINGCVNSYKFKQITY